MRITFNIPRLISPFETRVSKFEDEVDRELRKWWTRIGVVTNNEELEHIAGIRTGSVSCRSIPDSSFDEILFIAKLASVSICIDDMFDGMSGDKSEQFFSRIERVKAIAKGEKIEPKDALERAGLDLQEDAMRYYKNQLPLIRRGMDHLFRGMQWEMKVNRRHRIPSLTEYVTLRPVTVFFDIIMDMYEPLAGIELPMELRCQTPIRELYLATIKINWILNDIASIAKELKDNCTTNLVIVLKHELNCDWQTAMDEAVKMLEEAYEEFLIAEKLLVKTGDQKIDDTVVKYIQLLKDLICGQYHLYDENPRFGSCGMVSIDLSEET
ncbi:hypothetical protein B4U80_12015 [Leptotrombidium deliense]|uniref:Terpene synthase n=1 Tax=Leptotrombidium deliense TaxID=299467 RepID=A0A443RZP8_9ACAR|nr:hypothetical protein B4U80_12015 [Leptotrombidium deliense]